MKRSLQVIVSCLLCFSAIPAVFSQEQEPIANYQVLFSPVDQVAEELIALIEKEQKSIKAAIYALMHRGIIKALVDAKSRGVNVEVIVDPFSIRARAPLKKMQQTSLPIFVWSPPAPIQETKSGRKVKKQRSVMHDKFCIFGDHLVWTGSFNFTYKATHSNRENVIVLENQEVANRYLKEFESLKKEGCMSLDEYLALK